MDRVIDDTILSGIGAAIRRKTGESGLIVPENMSDVIDNIEFEINLLPNSDPNNILSHGVITQTPILSNAIGLPLGAINTDATAYIVSKSDVMSSEYPRLVSLRYSTATGCEPCIYADGRAVGWTTYYSDSIIPNVSAFDRNLYVLSVNNTSKKAKAFVNGSKVGEKDFVTSGDRILYSLDRYSRFGISFIGAVKGSESDEIIIANSNIIMNYFGIL